MAKRPVKQQAAKRPVKPARALAKSTPQKATAKAAPAKKTATSKKPVPAKAVAKAAGSALLKSSKAASKSKPAKALAAVVKAVAKTAPVVKTKAAKASAAVKSTAKAVVAPKQAPSKPAANTSEAKKPAVAKASKPAESEATSKPTAKPTVAATSSATTSVAPTNGEPKPAGRPMLSQGPFVGSTLTKRGTFAPNKVAPPPSRLPTRRPKPADLPPAPVVAPPVPAVATGEKAAKNRAGLSQRDLDTFRDLLLAKRRELLGDMSSMEREALRESNSDLSTLPIHMADQGTDAYEQEFTLRLVEDERGLLREVNNALAKIQNGTYGLCEGTGLPISKARLEAQPWAKHSIEHARALEKRKMTFRR